MKDQYNYLMGPSLPPTELRFMQESDSKFLELGELCLQMIELATPLKHISSILDIGCGYGRLAHALIRNKNFSGKYFGIDILPKHIEWCKNFIQPFGDYQFSYIDIKNDRYNPKGAYTIGQLDFSKLSKVDIVCFFSVFTHMYEEDIRQYLHHIHSILDKKGKMVCTVFLVDESMRLAELAGKSQYPMIHQLKDHIYYYNEKDSLHAISYEKTYFNNMLIQENFQPIQTVEGSWCGRKPTGDFDTFQDLIISTPKNSNTYEEYFCSICGSTGPFTLPYQRASKRESICPQCHASRRTRDCTRVLLREVCGSDDVPLQKALHSLRSFKILELQTQGPLHDVLSLLPNYQCCEYINGIPSGGRNTSNILCQDLFCLTFIDNAFDIVITQDVFEHVEDPWLCFEEVNRVLKKGGKHIFTVPIHESRKTCTRAYRNIDGSLCHNMPEVYHGDPLNAKGSLVYTDFGDDIIELLNNQGHYAQLVLHTQFYKPEEINSVNTEEDHKRYLFFHSREKDLQFFLYNSCVFTITQKQTLPSRKYRIRYTDTTNVFQVYKDWYQHFFETPVVIHSIRSETVTFYGRCSCMLDITLSNKHGPCVTLIMVEICWGDFPCFIFSSVFREYEHLLHSVVEQLCSLFSKEEMKNWNYSEICIDAHGSTINFMQTHERVELGTTLYYTLIPHLRRYAFVKEQHDLGRIFDVGCGTGYGLAMLYPQEGAGLDISKDALTTAQNYYPSCHVKWIQTPIEQAVIEERYDTIINFENIEHLDDHISLINLFKQSLSQDGKVFISIPNPKFHSKNINHYHKRDFDFHLIQTLLEDAFSSVQWFYQNDILGDLSQRFLIKEGIDEDAQFWLAKCQNLKNTIIEKYDVSVIIPVFNKWEYTQKALESIFKYTNEDIRSEVIVIDNASSDNTEKELIKFKHPLRIYRNQNNLGFAKACNQGAMLAQGDILVFLNNDTEVQAGWLSALVNELHTHPETGIVGGKLLYPDGTVQHAGVVIGRDSIPIHIHRLYPANHPLVQARQSYPVITAACAAVRRKDFLDIGMFDEFFINGHEDIDLCLRFRKKGKVCVYRPDCVVTHYESLSEGRMNSRESNLKRTIAKHCYELIQDDFEYTFRKEAQPNATPLRFAIKVGVPDRFINNWGDIYYAECLAKYLVRLGHHCVIHYLSEWGSEDIDVDVVIHLKGLSRYYPKPWNINIMWMLNHPDLHTKEELEQYDAICVASEFYTKILEKELSIPVFFLPQATDPEHFRPMPDISKKYDIVFVGNNKDTSCFELRKAVTNILPTKYTLAVWGEGWVECIPDEYFQDTFVSWENLPIVYNSSCLVLNDHQPTMAFNGFVNNRTFDVLACGVLVVSDFVHGMEQLFNTDILPQYDSKQDLQKIIDYYITHPQDAAQHAEQLRQKVLTLHTFKHRVATFEQIIKQITTANVIQRCSTARKRIQDTAYRRNGPLISILMGTCNRKHLLKRAIESIRKQTYTNWELRLVCDGGKPIDALVKSFEDDRIHLYHFNENKGKGYVINYAFHKSAGEYIAYLDDDDIWYPDHLESLMLMIRELQGIHIAYSDVVHVTVDCSKNYSEISRELPYHSQVTIAEIMEFNSVSGITLLHHRDLYLKAGMFDTKLKALIDFDMWKRLFAIAYPYHVSKTTADRFIYTKNNSFFQITSLYQRDIISYCVQRIRIMSKKLTLPSDSPLHKIQQDLKQKTTFEYASIKALQCIRQGKHKKARSLLKVANAKYTQSVAGKRQLALCYLELKDYAKAYFILSEYIEVFGSTITDIFYAFYAALELRDKEKIITCIHIIKKIEDKMNEPTVVLFNEYMGKASKILGEKILNKIWEA